MGVLTPIPIPLWRHVQVNVSTRATRDSRRVDFEPGSNADLVIAKIFCATLGTEGMG